MLASVKLAKNLFVLMRSLDVFSDVFSPLDVFQFLEGQARQNIN